MQASLASLASRATHSGALGSIGVLAGNRRPGRRRRRCPTACVFAGCAPHARGGLGEVFVALDEELHREVALKEIQERFADHPDSRARFLREAEITGNLEHPGVVPVYGLGAYADGRPYYAMRFIRGERMQEAIERFHKADEDPRRDPGERSLALRELLGRFVAVCNAVAYAHSRGVIHRDLKPANVMLGEYGETLVVDWGLARLLDQADSEQTAAERPLLAGLGQRRGATQMGQVVGTPAFMPPEQAAGGSTRGPGQRRVRLGATLYCLLTGQAALPRATTRWPGAPGRGGAGPAAQALGAGGAGGGLRARRWRSGRRTATSARQLAEEVAAGWRTSRCVRTASRWPSVYAAGEAAPHAGHGMAVLLMTATAALAVGLVAVNAEKNHTPATAKPGDGKSPGSGNGCAVRLTDSGEKRRAATATGA